MALGTSLFLIAVGAILRYAVSDSVPGIDLPVIGLILMIVGIIGLLISLFTMTLWNRDRRGGVVEALTRAACERLRERGARTVLLYATDMGRPLYERLGFEHEGSVTAWRGTAGSRRADVTLRAVREDDRAAIRTLDRAATGEDRSAVLDALHPLSGLFAERAGEPAGWAVTSPWGAGVAVCAADEPAGVALTAAPPRGP